MSVTGDGNGIPSRNERMRRMEPLINVALLKQNYLFGLNFKDSLGRELPREAFQEYINNAVSFLEHYLDIAITPVIDFVENRDYLMNEYADWGFFELANYPVLRVKKIEMVYLRNNDGVPETVTTLPNSWIRLQEHDGIVRLMPNSNFPANLQISQVGSFFPEIMRTDMVPHLWRITYDYGFDDGKIPSLLNEAIALVAAQMALSIGGNLVLGAGIAGTSIGLDGLSQSVQTTQSAENSAFSATLIEYRNRAFGKTEQDPYSILRILKNFYKGQDMGFI